jgi:hypothetical protein
MAFAKLKDRLSFGEPGEAVEGCSMNPHDAEALADSLLDKHGLSHWTFALENLSSFGQCTFSAHKIALSLRTVWISSEATVKDALLHEIAHALEPRDRNHGPFWRIRFLCIGGSGERYIRVRM